MATLTKAVLPLTRQVNKDKPAYCEGCDLFNESRLAPRVTRKIDLLVVGPAPMPEDIRGGAFRSKYGQMFKNMLTSMQKHLPIAEQVRVEYVYVVNCCPGHKRKFNATAQSMKQCTVRLMHDVKRFQPKVILLLGKDTLKPFGYPGKLKDYRGNIYERKFSSNDEPVFIVPTFSPVQTGKNPGLTETFKKDVQKALTCMADGPQPLDFDLRCPVKFKDIMHELGRFEADLAPYKKTADGGGQVVAVSMDTETTSLNPWDEAQRMIAMSMGWDSRNKKGLAFPLDHKKARLTVAQREVICREVTRIFETYNIKLIMHNSKFDEQWLNYAYALRLPACSWDTLLMEHLIDEDKTGEYSLKQLTRDYYPGAGKYEDELKNIMEDLRTARQKERRAQDKVYAQKRFDALVTYWVDLEEDTRLKLISAWIGAGFIKEYSPTVIQLERRKQTKKQAEAGITPAVYKRCEKAIVKTLKSVPLTEFPDAVMAKVAPFAPDPKLLEPITFEDVPLRVMLKYAAIDGVVTHLLVPKQQERMKEEVVKEITLERKLGSKVFEHKQPLLWTNKHITMPMRDIISDMEYNGIRLDRERTRRYSEYLSEKIVETADGMMHHLGYEFNPRAEEDLVKILYEDMKLPVIKRTEVAKTPSTDAATLLNLFDQTEDPFLKQLLMHRKLEKCKSTYLDNWLERSAIDGKIHAKFNQNRTATGRLSSSDPNLQNVMFYLRGVEDPDKPGKDINLKSLFIPDSDDFEIVDLDISNAEMRILCAYSLDPTLIKVFREGLDMHCLTGAGISEFTYDDIKAHKEEKGSRQFLIRQVAKAVNFGTVFCMGADTLKQDLWDKTRVEVTKQQSQEYLDGFFTTYPGVQTYIDDTINFVMRHGWTYTFTGRRRRFPHLAYDRKGRSRAGRQAVNARIQPTSSDVVSRNMVNVNNDYVKPMGGRMLLTVHDSMVFQVPKGLDRQDMKQRLDHAVLEKTAQEFPWLPVPWKYDADIGPSYGENSAL